MEKRACSSEVPHMIMRNTVTKNIESNIIPKHSIQTLKIHITQFLPSLSLSMRTFFNATISSDLVSRARSASTPGDSKELKHSNIAFPSLLTYTQCHTFLLQCGWASQTLWHFCSCQTEKSKMRKCIPTSLNCRHHDGPSSSKKCGHNNTINTEDSYFDIALLISNIKFDTTQKNISSPTNISDFYLKRLKLD